MEEMERAKEMEGEMQPDTKPIEWKFNSKMMRKLKTPARSNWNPSSCRPLFDSASDSTLPTCPSLKSLEMSSARALYFPGALPTRRLDRLLEILIIGIVRILFFSFLFFFSSRTRTTKSYYKYIFLPFYF